LLVAITEIAATASRIDLITVTADSTRGDQFLPAWGGCEGRRGWRVRTGEEVDMQRSVPVPYMPSQIRCDVSKQTSSPTQTRYVFATLVERAIAIGDEKSAGRVIAVVLKHIDSAKIPDPAGYPLVASQQAV